MRLARTAHRDPVSRRAAAIAAHPSLRRQTVDYQKKKRLVRNIWIVALLCMIALPPALQIALALGTSFTGLVILDETS